MTPVSVVMYVQRVQERLKQVQQLAGVIETKAKTNAKVWYDRNARQRTFEVGEQGTGVASCTEGQVVSEWHGPYTIHKRITDITYKIIMPEKRKKNRVFHVNMIARWKSPTAACLVVEEATEERVTGEELSTWPSESNSTEPEIEPEIEPDLSEQQKQELWCAVKKHRKLFQDTPGRTNLTQTRIEMGDAAPIHLPQYQLPKEDIRQFRTRFSSY